MTESPFMDSGFAVHVFSEGDDLIACLTKAMALLTAIASSRFPSTNNRLRTSSNPKNQATIQDGRVTVQQVQGRQDPGVPDDQAVQTIILNNAVFQTRDLDTYDSDCDDIANAKAVLIANISNYGSDVISEVESSTTSDSNTPVLSPTRLKCFTSNCGSKPTRNKKNDRNSETPSRNMKKNLESQPRKVNKKNHVVEPISNVDVKQSRLNANSEFICATCCSDCSPVSRLWMFKTYDKELLSAHELSLVTAAPRAVDLTDSLVSMSINQDAPLAKPKNFKQAMIEPSWIDAMKEEIHEFERL
nr:hypothetical protein [Tanacetum cinerariifolium]